MNYKIKEVCDLCEFADENKKCYVGIKCYENEIFTKFKLKEEIIKKEIVNIIQNTNITECNHDWKYVSMDDNANLRVKIYCPKCDAINTILRCDWEDYIKIRKIKNNFKADVSSKDNN